MSTKQFSDIVYAIPSYESMKNELPTDKAGRPTIDEENFKTKVWHAISTACRSSEGVLKHLKSMVKKYAECRGKKTQKISEAWQCIDKESKKVGSY